MTFSATSEQMDPIDIIENIALEKDWEHERFSDIQMLITKKRAWGNYNIVVVDMDDFVRFTSFFPYTPMGYAELEFYKLMNMINAGISKGSLHHIKETNNLAYVTYVELDDDRPISSEFMENRIDLMATVLDRFFPCFMAIMGQDTNQPDHDKEIVCIDPCMSARGAFKLAIPGSVGQA